MIHTRAQLAEIVRAGRGTLEETPYPTVLLALATNESSAVLDLRRHQLQKTVIFDSGAPVECRSNIATEMLGRFLVSSGKVSEQDCHAAFAVAASRGVPLGEVLTERKLLAPTELYKALQQNLGRKLLEPFSWTTGTWSISSDAPRAASVLRVKVPQLLVTGIMKVEPEESADEAVAALRGKYVSIADEPLFGLADLRLSKEQQRVVDAARRSETLEQIAAAGGIDADDLNRIVYALLLLGIVHATDRPEPEAVTVSPFLAEEEAETPVVVTIDETAEPPAATEAVPFALTLPPAHRGAPPASAEEVISAYLGCRRRDAFEMLELDETAGPIPITQAFLRFADKFLPSKFDEGTDLRDKAQEVFLAASRAYGELADADRREALIKRRQVLREQAAAAAQAGQQALIDPELLYKSGRALAAAGKLREALSSFEMAAECDVQNGTYAAEAVWARFQLRNTPASVALKLLKNAIRIDPHAGTAYLYVGQVMALLGNKLEGQAYVSKAASLMPNDPRPAQAMKQLS